MVPSMYGGVGHGGTESIGHLHSMLHRTSRGWVRMALMSSCSHPVLQAQRARKAGPFQEVVKATIKDLNRGEWGHSEAVSEAFYHTTSGSWAAPAGWAGKGGPMDGTVLNPWYGLFPPQLTDGLCSGEGDVHRSGEL